MVGDSLRNKRLKNKTYSAELSTIQTSEKQNALYLSLNVFSTKVLAAASIFGTAILRGYPSHAEVYHLHDKGSTSQFVRP